VALDLFPDRKPDLREMIAELDRELKVRRTVYARWVASGQLKQQESDRRISCMEAARDYLEKARASGAR